MKEATRHIDEAQIEDAMPTAKSAEVISGRATGVLFFAGFGSLWLYSGISAMHRLNPLTVAAILTIGAALAVPAVMLMKSSSKAAHVAGTGSLDSPEIKRTFFRMNLMQYAAIFSAIVLFNALHKQEFLATVITFIVGSHLIPLARLFRYSAHYVTGGLLMAWAMIVAIAFPGNMMPTVGALGTAVILLGSAAYTLALAGRAVKSGFVSNRLSAHGV
jgi:hypothetical protein